MNIRLAIILPASDKELLEAIAIDEDRSVSSVVRRLIAPFLATQRPPGTIPEVPRSRSRGKGKGATNARP